MKNWVVIAKISDFAATDRKLVNMDNKRQIALFKRADGYYAIGAWCSHEKALLLEGIVTDHEVACPLHGARFDLRTGKNMSLPAVRPIPQYPVKVENDNIYVQL